MRIYEDTSREYTKRRIRKYGDKTSIGVYEYAAPHKIQRAIKSTKAETNYKHEVPNHEKLNRKRVLFTRMNNNYN